jgi:hypothetical protein
VQNSRSRRSLPGQAGRNCSSSQRPVQHHSREAELRQPSSQSEPMKPQNLPPAEGMIVCHQQRVGRGKGEEREGGDVGETQTPLQPPPPVPQPAALPRKDGSRPWRTPKFWAAERWRTPAPPQPPARGERLAPQPMGGHRETRGPACKHQPGAPPLPCCHQDSRTGNPRCCRFLKAPSTQGQDNATQRASRRADNGRSSREQELHCWAHPAAGQSP